MGTKFLKTTVFEILQYTLVMTILLSIFDIFTLLKKEDASLVGRPITEQPTGRLIVRATGAARAQVST